MAYIETWITTSDELYLAHLDRSEASPFRSFAFSRVRGDPGAGSFQYRADAAILDEIPGLMTPGHLVWMRFRGKTTVWVIEDSAEVTEGEAPWVKISGRGAKQLLGDRTVWPPDMSDPPTSPATWSTQWRTFIGRAAGEMLWDLIEESNPRFPTQLVRGVVETDPLANDDWTAEYRFHNLLDVAEDVETAFGDVVMDGLTFSYYTALGTDRSLSVIFEEGADLVRLERDISDRDTITWAVAEGVGEGVFAKLKVAQDQAGITRRREGYVDAKDAGNTTLLAIRATSAVVENRIRRSVHFTATEDRFRAFLDYDLGDTVRAIHPTRKVDTTATVEAIYVAEQGDRVRIDLDLAKPRRDLASVQAGKSGAAAKSISVLNRMPQGQLVPFSFSGADVFDDTDTMDVFLHVPERMYVLVESRAMVRFRQFFAPAKAASSGGGSTSGASSSSSSGASSASTSSTSPHLHIWGVQESVTPGAFTKQRLHDGAGDDFNLETTLGAGNAHRTQLESPEHDHSIAHTHNIAHTHSTPDHTHGLDYGVFKETMPGSWSVDLKVYLWNGSSWDLISTVANLTGTVEDVDLTAAITGPGVWRLELKSDAAQPNGGRLGCDVAGYVLGAIKSA